jgi:hypothetical protein
LPLPGQKSPTSIPKTTGLKHPGKLEPLQQYVPGTGTNVTGRDEDLPDVGGRNIWQSGCTLWGNTGVLMKYVAALAGHVPPVW